MTLLLILLFFILKLFQITKLFKTTNENYLDIVNIEYNSLSCIDNDIFCTQDVDCFGQCNFQFKCNKQKFICEPSSLIENIPIEKINCDQKRGAFSALSTNILGELEYSCIETLPNLFSTDGTLRPYVCGGKNENFQVNLEVKNPEPEDCSCKGETFLVVKDTDVNTPRCARYSEINLLTNLKKLED